MGCIVIVPLAAIQRAEAMAELAATLPIFTRRLAEQFAEGGGVVFRT